jgi:two-component system response regulator
MEQKKIILLVEDNKQDEILTVRVLQQNGLRSEIVICRDGAEALDWIFNKGSHIDRDSTLVPHVVLLDLKLPKVNGQTKHLPVVILTTSKQESDIARSYQGGANSYVQKPVRFEEFSEVIQRLGVYWCATNIPASDAGPERNF